MSKTFIIVAVVGNAIAAVLATWPDGIPSAIAAGFLAGYALTEYRRDPAA
jgi:flavin-dependent dehydrogenase